MNNNETRAATFEFDCKKHTVENVVKDPSLRIDMVGTAVAMLIHHVEKLEARIEKLEKAKGE